MQEEMQQRDNCGGDNCPECQKSNQEVRENEDSNFAVLISLVPLLVLTFFSQVGML
ncbi:MAG: hypothetical protein OEV93_00535 [Candidatus Moranbacteria bacterium]|nr:hypothetical protein [Candidatus Moranbacteria bacterium]